MRAEQLKKEHTRIAVDVLEKLAFVIPVPGDPKVNQPPDSPVGGRVFFEGPFSGSLAVILSEPSLPELAGNMLGIDEEETDTDHQHDALREILNVLCGNILAGMADKRARFRIGSPEIMVEDRFIQAQYDSGPVYIISLDLEGWRCDLLLFIESPLRSDADSG